MTTLREKRRAKKRFPNSSKVLPGRLGDGFGNVRHPTLANHCYARIAGVMQVVYNDQTPYQNDLEVECGRDVNNTSGKLGVFKVLKTRTSTPGGAGVTLATGYAPAKRYEYMAPGGGQDPLWVQGMQFIPLRVGQYSGMVIQVQAGMVWTGTDDAYIPFQTYDTTSHLPTMAGKAALVLITVKNDGTIVATKGAEFTLADMTTPALILANRPAAPAGTVKELSLVRVYTGQTACVEGRTNTDFTDLRFTDTGGSGLISIANGGTGETTTQDAINALTDVVSASNEYVLTKDTATGDAIFKALVVSGMTNPMTTAGDIIIGGSSGAPGRLALGTAGQVLKVNAGGTAEEWGTVSGTGDVVGPASAIDGHLAVFDGATGKLIKDGGAVPAGGSGGDFLVMQVFS